MARLRLGRRRRTDPTEHVRGRATVEAPGGTVYQQVAPFELRVGMVVRIMGVEVPSALCIVGLSKQVHWTSDDETPGRHGPTAVLQEASAGPQIVVPASLVQVYAHPADWPKA